MMPELQIVDTFSKFMSFWGQVQNKPFRKQIQAWDEQHISQWPELRQKLINCYLENGEEWQAMALKHVFPSLAERLPAMQTAHDNLLHVCADVYGRCQAILGFDSDVIGVIYVGIGCGAGWATTYNNKPAILFGLENIAEEGWQARETLSGLTAHELGHLTHFYWRRQSQIADEVGPWWQLYTEGFAQRCEHLIQGQASWHMQTALGDQWQAWCRANLAWLAAEFLRRVDNGEDIGPFFGSWFDLHGYKQTGYFLGHELIKKLQVRASLRDIALVTDLANRLRPLLVEMAD